MEERGLVGPGSLCIAGHPVAASWEADCVVLEARGTEIEDDDNVIAAAALVPTVKSYYFVIVIDVMDMGVFSSKAAGGVEPVAAQVDEVTIELDDAGKSVDV